MTKRIGVFVCHCGFNIASTVDVTTVTRKISEHPSVIHTEDYVYMCSDPGQKMVEATIKEKRLDGVVVACCTSTLHEDTFRRVAIDAGINPYMLEIANIREQCSWVHEKEKATTDKAISITKAMVEQVSQNEPLIPLKVPVTRKALVIGGGVAGIQAALDIADMGYKVFLVEKSPTIGGKMAQLSETFPTLDCSQCILTPKMVSVSRHPNITLLTYSEVQEISGYVGNFKVKILKKPTYVDPEKCTLCDKCVEVCPVTVPNEFDRGLSLRKAIYIPFPQAVPASYTLDEHSCLGLHPLRCDNCYKACDPQAINYDMQPEIIEEEIGAIVVAPGYQLLEKEELGEYGYGEIPDVIDGLQFERLLSASGPTQGEVKRPSDGKVPKDVVFVACVGSRDPEHHQSYCSKICCMYLAKHAHLYSHHVPDGQAYVFYIDIRAGGKGYEEFVQRVTEEDRILYLRGKVSKIFQDGDKTMVWGVDTLSGKQIEIAADLVVLATAIKPTTDAKSLANLMKVSVDEFGFFKEAHPKLRPVESLTSGIFLAGASQAPKDIPDAVSQASAAASKAGAILSAPKLTHEPTIAEIDKTLCTGCGICVEMCPYGALTLNEELELAEVATAVCEGCGLCTVSCPAGATSLKNHTTQQVLDMIEVMMRP
ncbi:MAG: 4Fe-4S binding protein [Promethearchaeota archaeon]